MKYPDESSVNVREHTIDWKSLRKTTFPSGVIGLESRINGVVCMIAYSVQSDMVMAAFGNPTSSNSINLLEAYGLIADEILLYNAKIGN